jgi:Cu(I)/Ag(I) efflux system periplasmic protein CusF
MKNLLIALVMVCATAFVGQVVAGDEHKVEGVIKGIKASSNKLTISHGPIKSMGMDGMTMDFTVSDPGMLEVVEEGQKVSFMIEVDKKGNFIITDIE